MRRLSCCLLIATCLSTGASADEKGLEKRLTAYLVKHRMDCPEELKAHHAETSLTVSLLIDRDGKLLNETVGRGSGSQTVDQLTLNWLKQIQPYPNVPKDVPAPYRFSFVVRFAFPSWPNEERVRRALENVCSGC